VKASVRGKDPSPRGIPLSAKTSNPVVKRRLDTRARHGSNKSEIFQVAQLAWVALS
jgi:hypothetical protein